MSEQIPVDERALVDGGLHHAVQEVAPDVAYQRIVLVNVFYIGPRNAADRQWFLVDTGVFGNASTIARTAAERFGKTSRPAAIIQTHGHFDHVGALEVLSEQWDAPIFAHELEMPYLNGTAYYPPPDPTVGGGLMSLLSKFYPRGPVDVSKRLQRLPLDGSLPGLLEWQWIHVPGHTPGQIALWRSSDRTLISADAFITTKQESAYAVMTQSPELHGPPMYYTQDWEQSRESVRKLAALEPETVITGHGPALHGPEMRTALHQLAIDFDQVAVPTSGHYVDHPARVADGTAYPSSDK